MLCGESVLKKGTSVSSSCNSLRLRLGVETIADLDGDDMMEAGASVSSFVCRVSVSSIVVWLNAKGTGNPAVEAITGTGQRLGFDSLLLHRTQHTGRVAVS